jgi:SET domain-containing protein
MKKFVLSPDLFAAKSKIHGLGLFTNSPVAKGTRLFTVKGIDIPRIKNVNRWVDTDSSLIDLNSSTNPILYLNHSCTPNVVVKSDFSVESIRPIKKNEELILDYATIENDINWKMNCSCKSTNCRNQITAFTNLPKELRSFYHNHIPQRIMMHIPLFIK